MLDGPMLLLGIGGGDDCIGGGPQLPAFDGGGPDGGGPVFCHAD